MRCYRATFILQDISARLDVIVTSSHGNVPLDKAYMSMMRIGTCVRIFTRLDTCHVPYKSEVHNSYEIFDRYVDRRLQGRRL